MVVSSGSTMETKRAAQEAGVDGVCPAAQLGPEAGCVTDRLRDPEAKP